MSDPIPIGALLDPSAHTLRRVRHLSACIETYLREVVLLTERVVALRDTGRAGEMVPLLEDALLVAKELVRRGNLVVDLCATLLDRARDGVPASPAESEEP